MTIQQETQETNEQSLDAVDGITFSRDGSLITARLDRPDGNLMTLAMCDALVQVLRNPPVDAHVLLLEAAGGSFCLGRERTASTPEDLPGEVRRLISLNEALLRTPLVTVAKVHGDAAGFGVGLAALTDVSVTTDAARFSFPEVKMDLAPTLVLAWLARIVGRRQAFWLTATGEAVSGAQAVRLGLINEVVATEADLDEETDRRVQMLQERSPRVHTEIRSMLRSASTLTEEQSYDLSADRLVLGSMRRRMS
ncbi:enoyl-CoA hydratase/isomerase family protein [Arthrobacter sp. SX1312]|uniref:enoyl-CoA hydratase/isomerase family protein n=1 Tax=Arthrobacter sp. SX1312 TaxID=2058896 RepID=UPI000CE3243B|nr:enoyl-CoA hydratase/isomerase family protein [Arthrobacter sp. SX1312]